MALIRTGISSSIMAKPFFDVTRDTQHPFLVKVDELEVSVLGTAFNIQSFRSSVRSKWP